MHTLIAPLIALCTTYWTGCASIAPIEASDALTRLVGGGHRPIDTARIDFPLLAAASGNSSC